MTMDEPASGTPFLGRPEVVSKLHRRLDGALAGTGGVTLLVGDTGIGKSTLVLGMVPVLRARGIRTIVGRAPATTPPPPYSLLQSAIGSASEDPVLRADENPPMAGNLFLIAFALPLGDVNFPTPVGIEARLLEVLGASDRREKVSPEAVVGGIAERFLEFTRHGPTVLILEDIDHADPSSLAAIEFFARELSARPLWILATTVPPESLSVAGQARLEEFERSTSAVRIGLPPMTSAETSELLHLHGRSGGRSAEELERCFAQTGGNPLLVLQLDRRSPLGRELRAEGADLTPLDSLAQQILEVAAVLGRQFPFDLLQRVSGLSEERLAEGVERIVTQGLLVERPDEILEFPVDRLRESAYERIPEIGRRILHRTAGEALEELRGADPSRVYELARHFYLGRASAKSVRYNRLAAEVADRALAPEVALEHLRHALDSSRNRPAADRHSEWELVLEMARVAYDLGRLEETERALRGFLEPEPTGLPAPVRATLEVCLAQTLVARGDVSAAQAISERVLAAPGLDDQLLVRIGAHHQLGQALYYEGHYPEALAHHSEEIRLARSAGNERVSAHAQLWHAGVLAITGEWTAAIAEAREVAAALDRLGSVRESGQGHLFLGNILADSKSPAYREEAISELEEAIRLGERANDPRRVGWAFYHTAELLRAAGRLEESGRNARRACETLGRVGDRTGLAMSLKVRGQVAMEQGAYDAAEQDLTEAYRGIQGRNQSMIEVDVVLRLAQLSIARGDLAGARRQFAEMERQHLPTIRPDLSEEFARLQRDLAPEAGH
ncbi:MAG: AAA family ATPase [Thermoplasmata archaeon]|nr:AAA family ATPase [Thermoplasmata archaeon]